MTRIANSLIMLCFMAILALTQTASALRATPCMAAQSVTMSTFMGNRVTVTIPNQASLQGKFGIDTIQSTCGSNSGTCQTVTTDAISNPAPYQYCYNSTWPTLTFTITSAGGSSTTGVFTVDPNTDFPDTWVPGVNILLSGDAYGPDGHDGCKSYTGNEGTQPLYVCPNASW